MHEYTVEPAQKRQKVYSREGNMSSSQNVTNGVQLQIVEREENAYEVHQRKAATKF